MVAVAVSQLWVLSLVVLLAFVSPGPDFVAVVSFALGGRRGGIRVALGIALASFAWALLAMAGLGLVLGRLTDRIGPKRTLWIVLVLWAIGLLIATLAVAPAPAVPSFFLSRIECDTRPKDKTVQVPFRCPTGARCPRKTSRRCATCC